MEQQKQPTGQPKKTNVMAILGFIFAFLFPLLGIIFCIIALSQMNKDNNQKGKGLAIAGLILGIIFFIIVMVILMVLMILITRSASYIG